MGYHPLLVSRKNLRILEREVDKLYQLANQSAISFDLAKTELIHFGAPKKAKTSLALPNQEVISAKDLLEWLGLWFDKSLSFKQHLNIRISQAKSAFLRLVRRANIEREALALTL